MSLTGYLRNIANSIRQSSKKITGKINAQNFPSLITEVCNENLRYGEALGYKTGFADGENDGYAKGRNEGFEEGYNFGFKNCYEGWWSDYQQVGSRENYTRAFSGYGWTDNTFKPMYDMTPSQAAQMFERCNITDLTSRLEELGIKLDFSQSTSISQMFLNSKSITRVPEIKTDSLPFGTKLSNLFNGCSKLETIDNLHLRKDFSYDNSTFANCYLLKNLTITGEIGQNGLNVLWCYELTKESLMSIINALYDYSDDTSKTEWVVTLGNTNLSKLSPADIKIATDKGWVVK